MRWATGTFLRTLRTHLKSLKVQRPVLAEWRLWLATNPFFDPTAIWLEKKFDVKPLDESSPELVTVLPAIPTPEPFPRGSPGLIVFERIPLERIKDDVEKYVTPLCSLPLRLIVPPADDCAYSRTPCGCATSWRAYPQLRSDASSRRCWSFTGPAKRTGTCSTTSPQT